MIYDLWGRQVRNLVNRTEESGFKVIVWDATDNVGQPVSAGIYIYRITAISGKESFHQIRKMFLLKNNAKGFVADHFQCR
ncbi:MAG: hypothetical protein IID16_08345 [Candidatus Marinimicrobia bacterium]|nr:hypothetical protein [Candidatus Neomarinimicrobiota bacterium]